MEGILELLLTQRGVSGENRDRFLNPDYARDTHDPFLFADMDVAVKRLLAAIERREKIAIYADFDCDGIPAAVVMHDFLKKVGHENLEVYIPHRHNEGHGFHKGAVDTLKARGVSLIVTLDVGTVANETAAHAKSLGLDVIITDHHEPGMILPPCVALINPKREGYPFKDLCGAAVGFKLAQATLIEGRKREIPSFTAIPEGWEKWLLDMVGIATVADMVPLIGENRVLARFGLMVLRKSPRAGLLALCRKLRLNQSGITEDDIGFSIGPRINAASRMDCPELAFRLLSTIDPLEAETIAGELEKLNSKRKGTVAALVKEAKQLAYERFPDSKVAVLGNPSWKPALLGLAANSLMNERGGVVCLWGRDGNGEIKGSCRSDGSINIVEMFRNAQVETALEEAGGHAMAGGFSVSHEQVHHLPELFAQAVAAGSQKKTEIPSFDAELMPAHVTRALWLTLSELAPFGIGNPKPLFRLPSVMIESVRIFGKEQTHTEIIVRGDESERTLRAFEYFRTPDEFTAPPQVGRRAQLLGTVERDTFRGESYVLRLVDVL